MAESAGALAQSTAWVQYAPVGGWSDVENDVVGVCGIHRKYRRYPAYARAYGSEKVEVEIVTNLPCDHVVGAGRIAAHSDAADSYAALCQEHEPTAEDVDPANPVSDQWIVRGPEQRRVSDISDVGIYWITVLEAIKAATGLHSRVQVGSGAWRSKLTLAMLNIHGLQAF